MQQEDRIIVHPSFERAVPLFTKDEYRQYRAELQHATQEGIEQNQKARNRSLRLAGDRILK